MSDEPPSPTGRGTSPTVVAADEQDAEPVDLDRWSRLATSVLVASDVAPGVELNLLFVDEAVMAELNATHMGSHGPTDVLAFPIDDEANHLAVDGMPRLIGDVVVCPAVAARQAPEHAGTYDDELALLVVHGILHVLGMDHAEDAERTRMQARERELLAQFHAGVR